MRPRPRSGGRPRCSDSAVAKQNDIDGVDARRARKRVEMGLTARSRGRWRAMSNAVALGRRDGNPAMSAISSSSMRSVAHDDAPRRLSAPPDHLDRRVRVHPQRAVHRRRRTAAMTPSSPGP